MSIVSLSKYQNNPRGAADSVGSARRDPLEIAAEQFEALFLQQILKQMRKAGDVLAADSPMRSRELDTIRGFYDEVLADTLAGKKQVGIADLLVKQLSGSTEPSLDIERAGAVASSAELPERSPSFFDPLRSTWQRGVEHLSSTWQRGAEGFMALVDCVIERESAGRVDAVSPKGARGLMQLMPETAREMAAELGLDFSEERLTSDPSYNKQLGTAYLSKMLDRYDGEHALALAAYNAGPGRVDEWLHRNGDPRTGEVSVGTWVERIPFKETRDYTYNILRDLQAAARSVPLERPAPSLTPEQMSSQLSARTQAQVDAAPESMRGLVLGVVVGKRIDPENSARISLSETNSVFLTTRFKSPADYVVLENRTTHFAAGGAYQSRSAAFAQSIPIERKEIEA
jgi:soluble lytic murein transglycosylase